MVLTITAIVLAVKAYLLAHGVSIGAAAILAAVTAAMCGQDPIKAAMKKGASRAAADLLSDAIKHVLKG